MSKKRVRQQPLGKSAVPHRKKNRWAAVVIGLALILSLAGGILAQWRGLPRSAPPSYMTTVLPQAQATPSPVLAKEYIYTGSRLLATEEPAPAATPSTTPVPCSPAGPFPVLINEFRLRGANGSSDEYIELYNNSDSPVAVCAADGSHGWSLVAADGRARFMLWNGTVIPARGHYLGVNSTGYSLGSTPAGNGTTATGDTSYSLDIADNTGVALFNTTNAANFTAANVLDAVGFSGTTAPFSEGTPLAPVGTNNGEYCFVRKLASNVQPDTNSNAADFMFLSTSGGSFGGAVASALGAPGPENRSSPIQRNAQIPATLVDPLAGASSAPNRARIYCSSNQGAPCPGEPLGYLAIRRKYTNNTGQPITRLRWRIVDITAGSPPPPNTADLRAVTSSDTYVNTVSGPVLVRGTTLETPPDQPNGGGVNSTLTTGTITLSTPLAVVDDPNTPAKENAINVQFVLAIKVATGSFRFLVNIEALP